MPETAAGITTTATQASGLSQTPVMTVSNFSPSPIIIPPPLKALAAAPVLVPTPSKLRALALVPLQFDQNSIKINSI